MAEKLKYIEFERDYLDSLVPSSEAGEAQDDTTKPRKVGDKATSLFVEKPLPFDPTTKSTEHVPQDPSWLEGQSTHISPEGLVAKKLPTEQSDEWWSGGAPSPDAPKGRPIGFEGDGLTSNQYAVSKPEDWVV